MASALLVRLRPAGPWRLGPDDGSRARSATVLHSDTLYSALTVAMHDLGHGTEWIDATSSTAGSAVRLSSAFPFSGQLTFIQPPRTVWPPAQAAGKVRWDLARFVPLNLVRKLLGHEPLNDEQWVVEPSSECLLPLYKSGPAPAPFRIARRSLAPVDRVEGISAEAERIGVLEFHRDAGFWFLAAFSDDGARSSWGDRLRAAVRLLADTGIGGGRSRGWGRSLPPKFENVDTGTFLPSGDADEAEAGWWLLSLFTPADSDNVDWSRGNYSIVRRSGRSQNGSLKAASRMIAEGSVLAGDVPQGTLLNVSEDSESHPVYRSGLALAVRVPYRETDVWRQFERPAVEVGAAEAVVPPVTAEEEEVAPVAEEAPARDEEVPPAAETQAPVATIVDDEAVPLPPDAASGADTPPEPQGLLESGSEPAGLLEAPEREEKAEGEESPS